MSYGWVFLVIGLTIAVGFLAAVYAAERKDERAWWRDHEDDYIQIGRRYWR